MTSAPQFAARLLPVWLLVGLFVRVSIAAPDPSVTPTVFDEPELVQDFQGRITQQDLDRLVRALSSDEFAGRETGTPGQRAASRFVADYYHELGLLPPPSASGDGPNAFLQEFDLYGPELERAALRISRSTGGEVGYVYDPRHPDTSLYLAAGTMSRVTGPVEFRGLSQQSGGVDYEDYAVLRPGKVDEGATWVLSFAPDSLLLPSGATGPYASNTTWPRIRLNLPYDGGPLPLGLLLIADSERVAQESRLLGEVALSVGRLYLQPGSKPYDMPPVYVMTPSTAEILLEGSGVTLDQLRTLEAAEGPNARMKFDQITAASEIDFPVRPFRTENVVAYVEGVDPDLKDEYVVVAAHLDHVGVNPLLPDDQIFNGADDNASGTAALLEMAEAFMEARRLGFGPRRSIVFLHFTAEEKGLLGSRYYTDVDPLFPLDRTVAMINMDMIGRSDPQRGNPAEDYVYLIGSRLISEELHEVADRVNDLTGIELMLDERFNSLDDPNQFYKRSDQWNFGKHNVPFIFFFTGTHEDYHRPSDEADKLNYGRLTAITRLIFGTTWQVASQENRPHIDRRVD